MRMVGASSARGAAVESTGLAGATRGPVRRVLVVVLGLLAPMARAEVIGDWDFSTGSLAPVNGVVALSELRLKPYYAAFGGQPGAPAVAFGSTTSFGIAGLGGIAKTVLRVPDSSGYGPMGGLIAEFPRQVNATSNSLNRYTIIMDVLVRQAAYDAVFNRASGSYMSLFQTAPLSDGDLFIDVRDQAGLPGADRPLGVGGVYGGDVVADAWHRIAWVASLDAPTDEPRFRAYVDGQPVSTLVWDDLLAEGLQDNDSVKLDLVGGSTPSDALEVDGRFSITTLGQMSGGQLPLYDTSAFFLFNDNTDEVGEFFVAHLQVHDDALAAADILALGAADGFVIAVPEPGTLGLAVVAVILAGFARAYRPPSLRAARARCTSGSIA